MHRAVKRNKETSVENRIPPFTLREGRGIVIRSDEMRRDEMSHMNAPRRWPMIDVDHPRGRGRGPLTGVDASGQLHTAAVPS